MSTTPQIRLAKDCMPWHADDGTEKRSRDRLAARWQRLLGDSRRNARAIAGSRGLRRQQAVLSLCGQPAVTEICCCDRRVKINPKRWHTGLETRSFVPAETEMDRSFAAGNQNGMESQL